MLYQFQHFGMSEYFCKEYGENFSFPKHLHQSFEFITVLSGKMRVTVGDKIHVLSEKEAVMVFPNQLHSLSGENCEHMLCIFSPDVVKAFSIKTSNKIPENNKFKPSDSIINSINELTEESSKIRKKGVLYSVCADFDETAVYKERKSDNEILLYKIFEFTENNYNNECSLDDLAHVTGFSTSYLSRYFKNVTGISYNSYVNYMRISSACYILENTDSSVLQCSMDCGYKSLRSFNRNFKNITGKTPSEYKL